MKIAALSDIHGNVAALDAVLADVNKRKVDYIVNLGDICSGELFPCETVDRLVPLSFPTIRGNHERQILSQTPERMGLSDRHAASMLRKDQLAWLARLPATLWLSGEVLLVHGSPRDDLEYFLETVTPEGLRAANMAEIEERAAGIDAAVILCGHTHIQRSITMKDGRLACNPGSVGLPAYRDDHPYPHVVESGSPHARYAILSKDDGKWTADLRVVAYDWSQAASDAEANGRTDWSRALRTGRV